MRPPPWPWDRPGPPKRRPAFPSSPGRARPSRSTGGAPSRPCCGPSDGPTMILDDGGDATLLVHKGVEYEKAGRVPDPSTADSEEFAVVLGVLAESLREDPTRWTTIAGRHHRRLRGDDHRRPPAERDGRVRRAAVPGHQRERRGDQVQVRQQVRLPALAHRRHQPGHRRAHRGQDGRGLRVRRRGQGLRRVAPGTGGAGGGHRDRPHLRPAGGHGGLPGAHPGRRGRGRRHLRHAPPATGT